MSTDTDCALAVQRCLDQKTKPPGSLGRLESLAVQLATIQQRNPPEAAPARIVVFAADHGISRRGVSAFPREVTLQMLANFASGGAAVNVLARQAGAKVEVINVGVDCGDAAPIPGIRWEPVAPGTSDMLAGPAMSDEELDAAQQCGAAAVQRAHDHGIRVLGLGEMGIGNTTAAAALVCAYTGATPLEAVGRGTGIDARRLKFKRQCVVDALQRHRGELGDPRSTLAALGGLEIAALTGAMLAASSHRIPVLVDGYIVTAAALAACALQPETRHTLIFAHRSAERGHRLALKALHATPLLDLDMRLGEGSGAALALPLLASACAIVTDMASFASAGVSDALDH